VQNTLIKLTLKQPNTQWFRIPQMPNTSPEGSMGWHWWETDYTQYRQPTLISHLCNRL